MCNLCINVLRNYSSREAESIGLIRKRWVVVGRPQVEYTFLSMADRFFFLLVCVLVDFRRCLCVRTCFVFFVSFLRRSFTLTPFYVLYTALDVCVQSTYKITNKNLYSRAYRAKKKKRRSLWYRPSVRNPHLVFY